MFFAPYKAGRQSISRASVNPKLGSGLSFPPSSSLVIPKHIWEGICKVKILSLLACVAHASRCPHRCSAFSHGGGECRKPISTTDGDSVENSLFTPCETFVKWVQRAMSQPLGRSGLTLSFNEPLLSTPLGQREWVSGKC